MPGGHRKLKGPYALNLVGYLDAAVTPLLGLGLEIIQTDDVLTTFQAVRGTSGTSGTTTIELEKNGAGTGDTLSWTSSDSDLTLKSADISVSVTQGDKLTFKLISKEAGASDIFVRVS